MAAPSVLNIAVCALAWVLFHVQILGEEAYLAERFGGRYLQYKAKVGRYF